MPSYKTPFDLDPTVVIRDRSREDSFPHLLLRGIYDVMKREKGRMTPMEAFTKGFNVVVWGLATADPPRIRVKDKIIALTSEGLKREAEVNGRREMDKERKTALGLNKRRDEMQKDTERKLKELRLWLDQLIGQLPNEVPPQSPTSRPQGATHG
jgi:hypothetical protein